MIEFYIYIMDSSDANNVFEQVEEGNKKKMVISQESMQIIGEDKDSELCQIQRDKEYEIKNRQDGVNEQNVRIVKEQIRKNYQPQKLKSKLDKTRKKIVRITQDLCDKALFLFQQDNTTTRDIARKLQVCLKTIFRMKKQYLLYGTIKDVSSTKKIKSPPPKDPKYQSISQIIKTRPSIDLNGIINVVDKGNKTRRKGQWLRIISNQGYVLKKIKRLYDQQLNYKTISIRAKHCEFILKSNFKDMIFLDQTTFDVYASQEYYWLAKGQKQSAGCMVYKLHSQHDKAISLLAGITSKQFIGYTSKKGVLKESDIQQFYRDYSDQFKQIKVLVINKFRVRYWQNLIEKIKQINPYIIIVDILQHYPQLNPVQFLFGQIRNTVSTYKFKKSQQQLMPQHIINTISKITKGNFYQIFQRYLEILDKASIQKPMH